MKPCGGSSAYVMTRPSPTAPTPQAKALTSSVSARSSTLTYLGTRYARSGLDCRAALGDECKARETIDAVPEKHPFEAKYNQIAKHQLGELLGGSQPSRRQRGLRAWMVNRVKLSGASRFMPELATSLLTIQTFVPKLSRPVRQSSGLKQASG